MFFARTLRLFCAAAPRCALMWLAASCSSPDPIPPAKHSLFYQERAWADLGTIVRFGPRPSGSPENAALRAFIQAELESVGLTVKREAFTDETPAGPIQFENVYTDLPPATEGAPWIIIGTHFDTKRMEEFFVGANDGGSGTAILLELARQFAADPRPRRTGLRLLFIDGEEAINEHWEGLDNTYGSRYHAAQIDAQDLESQFGACVILDMLGDTDLNIVHETYSHRELMTLYEDQAKRLGLGDAMATRQWLPVKDDHLSFQRIGIPSVDLIDFTYGPGNSYWHTPMDTLEHCSKTSLGTAGRLVLGAMSALETWVLRP